MNERIKQLAEQATKQVTKPDGHYIVQEWQRVFAELIVAETLDKINAGMEFTWPEMEVKIKEHFGVRV
jgi:hypothetical protein